MRRLGIATMLVFSLVLGGCSNDDGGSPPPDSGVPDAGNGQPDSGVPDAGLPDSGTPDAGAEVTISISGYTFSPASLSVDPGTTITVENNDSAPHTVTSESADNDFTAGAVNGISFDTGTVPAGGTQTITIPSNAQSGTTIPYFCGFHTNMMTPPNGHITVN